MSDTIKLSKLYEAGFGSEALEVERMRADIERLQEHNEEQRKHIKEIERCRREERAELRNHIEDLELKISEFIDAENRGRS